jgi:ribosome-binding protein aMBF1 (putative translation factor)
MVVDGAVGTGGEPESSDSLRTFGAVVQALREHAGLSREEFGERVRFSKHTVASVELGRRMPDPTFVERAEEVLGQHRGVTEGGGASGEAAGVGGVVSAVGEVGGDRDHSLYL